MLLREGQVCEYVKHQYLATMALEIALKQDSLKQAYQNPDTVHMVHGFLQI